MNITDEQRQLCAELEAELRSGDTEWLKHDLWKLTATPPDTADGALEWLNSLFMIEFSCGRSFDRRWFCAAEVDHLIGRGDNLLEAMTALIVAAAEAWEQAK